MTATALTLHSIAGRSRIRIPEMRGDAEWFEAVRAGIAAYPGISRVSASPAGASLLVEGHDLAVRRIGSLAETQGWFRLEPPAPEPARARRGTDALVPVLVLLALVQAVRGQIMVPALTLLWYAARLD
ncbi:hypothetical protein [Thioalkalivibrio sp. XN8]|uniref:hypothetical protein n=1 Tax=Thioalkalivibrio sp. XN8 TaxID=2712863 RepID=UPI0013EDD398|nr:hypothetical protein [Thioalkalivibrio sp. XN8]NGP51951.1 hypothetical protein [Thioalkalivibrio sp. XN8]